MYRALCVCALMVLLAVAAAQSPAGAVVGAGQQVNEGLQRAANGTIDAVNSVANGTQAGQAVTSAVEDVTNATQNAVNTIANGTQRLADAVNGTLKALGISRASGNSAGIVSILACFALLLVLAF